jgi:hypothetical protein
MKHLKTFEKFNLLPYNTSDLHNQISLYKVADKIYCVVIKDQQLRAYVFLRLQEYYESASQEFQGQKFTWDKYMQWYKSADSPYGEKEVFTYGSDWSGFNLPSESIENCMKEIDDPNFYDEVMVSIITEIKEHEDGKFYLIGVDELDVSNDLLDHELAHGFYYTDDLYRSKMNGLISFMDQEARESIAKTIVEIGYNPSVVKDETQAYLSTGLIDRMDKDLLSKYTKEFEMVFKNARLKHHTKPQKLEITFL